MSEVVKISDYKPHFVATDAVESKTHVIPIELVAKIIDGRIAISEIEDGESMIRSLLQMLLEDLTE